MKTLILKILLFIPLCSYFSISLCFGEAIQTTLTEQCIRDLSPFKAQLKGLKEHLGEKNVQLFSQALLDSACAKMESLDLCKSVQGKKIYHYEKKAEKPDGKRVLVFSLIHGDEYDAGTIGRLWIERLDSMKSSRNTWRVVPVLNPDGVVAKTRTNSNKIDLNRNFPTRDWTELAQTTWQKTTHSNPRRFPGKTSGSEPEVQCALKQIEDFKPDFIVSIHTPLRVLDFDGPKISDLPKFSYLPWKSLGHLPGSLGRYMWFERQTPVLTLELKDNLPNPVTPLEELQDLVGLMVTKYKINSLKSENSTVNSVTENK